jgi:hypothetical protein
VLVPGAPCEIDILGRSAAICKVRTKITEGGFTIDAEGGTVIGLRDRRTRKIRLEIPDDAVSYASCDLDRNVVAKDQIRLIARTALGRVACMVEHYSLSATRCFDGGRVHPRSLHELPLDRMEVGEGAAPLRRREVAP